MIVLGRGAVLGASNPLLGFYSLATADGSGYAPTAPTHATWAVYDVSDSTKQLVPVSVATGTVNLTADAVTDLLSVGRYALSWTVPSNEPLGKHRIAWAVTMPGGRVFTFSEEFDVAVGALGGIPGLRVYALPSDLRDEGVDSSVVEPRVQRALDRATKYIERVTRRFFEPRALSVYLDGGGRGALRVGDNPVISLAAAEYIDEASAPGPISLTDVRVYNRHVSQGLLSPDDRNDSRLVWLEADRPFPFRRSEPVYATWRSGRQNVHLTGVFGYTDPDGSFTGGTPEQIRECCKMLALRDLPGMWSDPEGRQDLRSRNRLTSETTRDQSYSMEVDPRLAALGEFTGDPDIDGILIAYMAPPFVGSSGGSSLPV